jgi:hypothetical protein
MDIAFTKISDQRHEVKVTRVGGSTERLELDTRSALRHDLAHFAVELEVPIRLGYWGSVAAGASLTGEGIAGPDARLAELLAGPCQTLMRIEAAPEAYFDVLVRVTPSAANADLARRIHERVRQLRGHWQATPYGGEMRLMWPE